ncbi:MAG: hypothetical protein ISR90_02850 [Candidatus Marinimicrobia bacterium]|nr:hypothetical protein [Candidatus Neomarinimicrobiota bacterium]MBL7022978.1 hypothetical protein [Candidatus Neomarinimicrobiota bacterium]MBL7108796.1 hypothetical protein [Candidatus Neomarinimicrobiota bacterium]
MLKNSAILWILAIIFTLSFVVYQKKTGPTYPVSGTKKISGHSISYKLLRSEDVNKDVGVEVSIADSSFAGFIRHKRFRSHDNWEDIPMVWANGKLAGTLPALSELAGKRIYEVFINNQSLTEEPVIIRFKGHVPLYILIPHILFMFTAMLLSTRTGFEALFRNISTYKMAYITTVSLFIGGIVLGPIVQKFAFDAFWTGWPWGHDLTDNKTIVAMIMWVIAFVRLRKNPQSRWVVLTATIVLIAIYLIPHSALGSEFDYTANGQ